MIDVWINNGSGWNVETIESQYINISTYSHYQEVFIQTYLLWCHVTYINPSTKHSERIKKTDKKIAEKLNYDGIEFPVQEKYFSKIEVKNNICINVFGYENELVFPIYVSDQRF